VLDKIKLKLFWKDGTLIRNGLGWIVAQNRDNIP